MLQAIDLKQHFSNHYSFVGDCQIPLALKMFIEEKGKELIEKRLYRNFLLHCCNMHEYNVLSPGQVFTAFTQIQRFIRENNLQNHFTHWKDHQKNASEQKRQQNLTINTSNTEQGPIEQISPSCQRNDFSGIFKKEGKSNSSDSVSISSSLSKDSPSKVKLQEEEQLNKPDGTKLVSGSNNPIKNLVSNSKNENDDGLVKNNSIRKSEKLNGVLSTNEGIEDPGKDQKVQANGK